MSETFVNGSAVALLAFLFLLNLTQVARLVSNLLKNIYSPSIKDAQAPKLTRILDQMSNTLIF